MTFSNPSRRNKTSGAHSLAISWKKPVPGIFEERTTIKERLKADPQPEREAELEGLFQDAGTTFVDWSRVFQGAGRYIERDECEYLHKNFISHESYVFWALTHMRAEDNVTASSKLPNPLPKKSGVGFPVVAHIAQFDGVQQGLGEDVRTGYKIVHDILSDEIIITQIEFAGSG